MTHQSSLLVYVHACIDGLQQPEVCTYCKYWPEVLVSDCVVLMC